jgi:hypothetical protein
LEDLPDIDPAQPGIFDVIVREAARIRAARHGQMTELREKARIAREIAVGEFRLREEEAERRRGTERRQRALDDLY